MKRLYIGIGFLLVILILGCVTTAAFMRIHDPLEKNLALAGEAAQQGDWEQAGSLMAQVQQDWDRCRDFSSAVADHGPIEEFDALLARAQVFLSCREGTQFAAVCAQLSRLSSALGDSQKLSWWSLL